MNISTLSALELAAPIHSGELRVADVLDSIYAAINEKDKKYNCFISLCPERAYKKAAEVQALIDSGNAPSRLAGVPIGIKDNICVEGVPTTCGSRMLASFVPPKSAFAVKQLEDAGLIVVGKLNMDEFAMGSSTETSFFGATLNPIDPSRVPGGSSGGAAAALCAHEIPLALGSDTGGSVRQPAAFCSAVGFKPTYGAVSRNGLVAYASSFDQIGTMARTVEDCAALTEIISKHDPADPTSVRTRVTELENIHTYSLSGKRIAAVRELLDGCDSRTASSFSTAIEAARRLGAEVEYVSLPEAKYTVAAYYIIACAQASSNLSRYEGVRYGHRAKDADSLSELYINSRNEGFGSEVKQRLILGNFVLSTGYYEAYYDKALRVRRVIADAVNRLLDRFDFIASPTYPTIAPKTGESLSDPLKTYLGDSCTAIANLAGLPAVSVPCGDGDGMPVGLQLMAKPFGDGDLLGAAKCFEEARR